MDNTEFLKNFITEDLYLVKEKTNSVNLSIKEMSTPVVSEPEIEVLKKEEKEKPEFPAHKGGYKKKIIIGVNYANEEFIDASDLAFLLKILSAVNLTIDDVAIINLNNYSISIDDIHFWKADTFIIFDHASELIPTLEPYLVKVQQNAKILLSKPLTVIMPNKDQKQLLWTALQSLFLK